MNMMMLVMMMCRMETLAKFMRLQAPADTTLRVSLGTLPFPAQTQTAGKQNKSHACAHQRVPEERGTRRVCGNNRETQQRRDNFERKTDQGRSRVFPQNTRDTLQPRLLSQVERNRWFSRRRRDGGGGEKRQEAEQVKKQSFTLTDTENAENDRVRQ